MSPFNPPISVPKPVVRSGFSPRPMKIQSWNYAAVPDVLAARRLFAGADVEIIPESRHRTCKAEPNITRLCSS